ncbi:MAG TPA: hypothetical protein VHM31_12785 [Polyangia bacterium]|nr:hypothetical protein [Polyangia bacterium]
MSEPDVYTPVSPASPAPLSRVLAHWIAELTDAQLVALTAAVVFVLSAWPLTLVDLPPFQDLPNHVATAHIVEHPELFPQFAFNGFFKSNSLLALWFHLFGDQRLFLAGRLITAVTIAINAVALPALFLHFAGRRRMLVAMLFAWPLAHGFFVSMGFLNFAAAFGLSLLLLIVIDRQRREPSWPRALTIMVLAGAVWYAHLFPLIVVSGLVAWEALRQPGWRARIATGAAILLPLVPAGLLSVFSAEQHLVKADRAPTIFYPLVSYQNVWEMIVHLWRDASGALTRWGSMSLVPALLLPAFAWRGRRTARPLFSNSAMAGLAVAYVALPMMMSNWCYLNCRLVPFLWVGLALRLPDGLPRRLPAVLVACAVSFSAVLGLDYLRLDRDRAEFTAGMSAVPRGALLMPLLFKPKKTADFVASIAHDWGYYTVQKDAMVPLVFAVERSTPITWARYPPAKLIEPTLDQFASHYATPTEVCKALGQPAVDSYCTAAWHEIWDGFWKDAQPRYTHVLTWAMPAASRAMIPPAYRRTFAAGDLEIYERATP